MSGNFFLLLIAAIGWLIAAVFAYAFISLFGFFGIGFYGLLLLFICSQVELESGGRANLARVPAPARQNMSRAEHISWRLKQSLSVGTFRGIGFALTAIGFGGFLYFQLE